MGKTFSRIEPALRDWIQAQRLFFVGTAPLSGDGHINVSPKGPMESFRVLDDTSVAYVDFAGSGAETIAHLKENGRIVIMLCAFEGPPRIVRLHGTGSVHQIGTPAFDRLVEYFDTQPLALAEPGIRSVVEVKVNRIADSCGYSVPLMSYEGERPHQKLWVDKRLKQDGPNGVLNYVRKKNATSIDSLPAVDLDALPDLETGARRGGT